MHITSVHGSVRRFGGREAIANGGLTDDSLHVCRSPRQPSELAGHGSGHARDLEQVVRHAVAVADRCALVLTDENSCTYAGARAGGPAGTNDSMTASAGPAGKEGNQIQLQMNDRRVGHASPKSDAVTAARARSARRAGRASAMLAQRCAPGARPARPRACPCHLRVAGVGIPQQEDRS
jgi:hypothetical protein